MKQDKSTLDSQVVTYGHVQLDADGTPFVAGTTMQVVEMVMAEIAHGSSPEEMHLQHPYLSLGQIHSALAYYWDRRCIRRRHRATLAVG